MSKECLVYFPQRIPCSGHGICNSSVGQCDCEPGWESLSDLVKVPNLDCDMSILGIRILWSSVLLGSIIASIVALRRILRHFPESGFLYLFSDHRTSFPTYFLVADCSNIGLGVLKVYDPVRFTILGHLLPTIFWGCYIFFACTGATVYIGILAKFLTNITPILTPAQKKSIQAQFIRLDRLKRFFYFLYFMFTAILLLAFVLPQYARIIAIIHLTGVGFFAAFICWIINRYVSIIRKQISISVGIVENEENTAIQKLLKNLNNTYLVVCVFGSVGSFIFLIPAFWPFFYRKSGYIMALICLTNCIVSTAIIYSVGNSDIGKSGSPTSNRKKFESYNLYPLSDNSCSPHPADIPHDVRSGSIQSDNMKQIALS